MLWLPFESSEAWHTVTPDVLAHFLRHMPSLTMIALGQGLAPALSSDVFSAIAEHHSLSSIDLPLIKDKWVRDLYLPNEPVSSLFPKLRNLELQIADSGLEELLPYIGRVRGLSIDAPPGSLRTVSIVARGCLRQLVDLRIEPAAGSIIHASDLLLIAKEAPELEELKIPKDIFEENEIIPSSEGMTDEVVQELAEYLPNLVKLHLDFIDAELTELALLSLGALCPKLDDCAIRAKVDFEVLVKSAETEHWPELRSLKIYQVDEQELRLSTAKVREIAGDMSKLMPSLSSVYLPSCMDLDVLLDDLVDHRFYEFYETSSDEE